jgi:hypothetical protein
MSRCRLAIATFVVLFSTGSAVDLYVNGASGSDSNAGTKSSPFQTIKKGQEAARSAKSGSTAVTVFIRGGNETYFLATPFAITKADSGSPGSPVTYTSEPGFPTARLVGGKSIKYAPASSDEDFAALSHLGKEQAAGVMVANLKAQGLADYGELVSQGGYDHDCVGSPMELSLNGAVMELARYPNKMSEVRFVL